MRASAPAAFFFFSLGGKKQRKTSKTRKKFHSPAVLSAQPHGRRSAGVVFGLFASVLRFWSVRSLLFGLAGAPAQTHLRTFNQCAKLTKSSIATQNQSKFP